MMRLARANSSSTGPKLYSRCSATLFGPRSGCSTASPVALIASRMSAMTGSSSYSTSISAAASSAM